MITIFKLRIECANALQQCYAVNSDKIKHHLCLHIISARARRWYKNQEKEWSKRAAPTTTTETATVTARHRQRYEWRWRRASTWDEKRKTDWLNEEKSAFETFFFGCSYSRFHSLTSALVFMLQQVACALSLYLSLFTRARAPLYMWHISNFYIIPSMNRNLMNGTILVFCTVRRFIHSWPICMCSDYTIFSFFFLFIRIHSPFVARLTQIFHIYKFICVDFHRHPIHPSSGLFPISVPPACEMYARSLALYLVNIVCIYFRTSHIEISRSKQQHQKKYERITTHAFTFNKPKARFYDHTHIYDFQ